MGDLYRIALRGGRVARGAVLALALVSTACAGFPQGGPPSAGAGADPVVSTLWVVRHAERSPDPPEDPHLSEAGHRRAAHLAELLAGEGIARVLSTDTRRTRETAAPVAATAGVEVRIYDPGSRFSLHSRLSDPALAGRAVLVVGHSNTVPGIVERITGVAVDPIADDEYTRLYRLDRRTDGGWTTRLIRFGEGAGEVSAPASLRPPGR